jgi:hypothetical protein
MRTYLENLHKKSPAHKKRFALLTSGTFTLVIFAIWATVNFGSAGLGQSGATASANQATQEVNPFGSLMRGIGASFQSLRGSVDELKGSLEMVNFEAGFQEMRDNTINNYGQSR